MTNGEFWFTHFDLSNYKKMQKDELEKITFSIQVKSDNYVYSNGFVRYFFNDNNKMPLSMPTSFIQMKNDVDSKLEFPLSDMIEMEDVYLTVFISFSFIWTVKESTFSTKNRSPNKISIDDDFNDESSKFKQTKSFRILMLTLMISCGVAIVSNLVFLTVKIVKNRNKRSRIHRKNNYQQYTDSDPINHMKVTL